MCMASIMIVINIALHHENRLTPVDRVTMRIKTACKLVCNPKMTTVLFLLLKMFVVSDPGR